MRDWSASQYLKFEDERTRAARDLLARVPPGDRAAVYDLGCGPGNSTALLAERFPGAAITGLDSSPDMLRQARLDLPGCAFAQADLATWTPPAPADLLFANAVFQWIPTRDERFVRLLGHLRPDGVLAVQMPDNNAEPSHELLREVATSGPWAPVLAAVDITRDALPSPSAYYDLLKPSCRRLDIWHIVYNHVLPDAAAIVEWVKGTRLRPYLAALTDEAQRAAFVEAYTARLAAAYPPRVDGSVLLRFPRLFIVATV